MGAPRGWGRIEQTPSGWRAEIRIAGTRVRSSVCATRRDAQRWLDELRRQKLEDESGATSRGRARPSDATYSKIAEHLTRWWATGQDRVRTASTREGYARQLSLVLRHWGSRIVAHTTERDVAEWVAVMRARGLSTSTIRNRLLTLRALHAQAVRLRWLVAPPCEVPTPAVTIRSTREMASDEDLERMLAATSTRPDLRLAVLLAADAGLRFAEIPRLRRADVRDGWIHVAVRGEDARTKSGRGRDVPILTGRLREALLAAGDPPVPLTSAGLRSALRRALGADPRLHALRHRWVTRLVAAGEPVPHVQAWAGHARLATTQGYIHVAAQPSPAAWAALDGPRAAHEGVRGA